MIRLAALGLAALVGAGGLSLSTTAASAAIVCNRDGDCWHVKRNYRYQPSFRLFIHPDNWHWGKKEHFRFREHDGRGYWKNGMWMTF